jgi:hypothetical protein
MDQTPIAVEIQLLTKTPRLGDLVQVEVKVRNLSPRPLLIVGVLDGSEAGLRYPHYTPQIVGPEHSLPPPEWPEMTAPLRAQDFCRLKPGEAFDPTERVEGRTYLPLVAFREFRPMGIGAYDLSLVLSTESQRDEDWMGTLPYPKQEGVLDLLSEVPRLKVTSNTIRILVR